MSYIKKKVAEKWANQDSNSRGIHKIEDKKLDSLKCVINTIIH